MFWSPCVYLLLCIGVLAAAGQEPLTLRQAINEALSESPQAAMAHADQYESKSAAAMARIQLLPQLNFTEDISRGNDPVHAFGTRLRQRQFTQADFALNSLDFPQPIGNFSTRFSGSWTAFDSFKTQRAIRSADLVQQSASSSGKAVNQQIVFQVVGAYQSVLYAQREIDVAQHEQETATALLASVAPGRPMPANSAEDSARGHLRQISPSLDCILDPNRHRNGTDMTAFADQIYNGPMSLSDL
jgi:outer membrane protein TolC